MRQLSMLAAAAVLMVGTAGCGDGDFQTLAVRSPTSDELVRINQIQVLGSHNSYHIEPEPRLMKSLLRISDQFLGVQYTHPRLDEQFESEGIRQIELDVFADPAGGLYAQPTALTQLHGADARLPGMEAPGFKVLHIQDLDFLSTCPTFVTCLHVVKDWSDAHPHHLPIMILVEAKDDTLEGLGLTIPIAIGPEQFDALDVEIRSVFPEERLITPDAVRQGRARLEDAVLSNGWPTLGEARGRVLFTLDNASKRDTYLTGHPGLRGRVLFTNAEPGDDDAAFVEVNDPFDTRIPDLVAAGYVVRTRADADTVEARSGNTLPRDAALASGAQYVSTDYPVPDPRFATGYFVSIPEGAPARCNPVNAPSACRSDGLE